MILLDSGHPMIRESVLQRVGPENEVRRNVSEEWHIIIVIRIGSHIWAISFVARTFATKSVRPWTSSILMMSATACASTRTWWQFSLICRESWMNFALCCPSIHGVVDKVFIMSAHVMLHVLNHTRAVLWMRECVRAQGLWQDSVLRTRRIP